MQNQMEGVVDVGTLMLMVDFSCQNQQVSWATWFWEKNTGNLWWASLHDSRLSKVVYLSKNREKTT